MWFSANVKSPYRIRIGQVRPPTLNDAVGHDGAVQVASFSKGDPDSKFTEDTSTKHDAASVAVTEAAQKFLYPDFYRLRGLSSWPLER